MRHLALIANGLLAAGTLAAQTSRGTVTSMTGHQPIANATVTARRAGTTVTTDRLGRFALRVAVPETLIVAAIGFRPDTVALDSATARLAIVLAEAPVIISDLIAVATRERPLDLSHHGRWEMPIEAARAVPAAVETDVYRALALVPGVSFTSPLSARPMIRGYDAQETVTRIDGFETINLFHLGRVFSSFPADAAESINLLAAPSTSSNGGSTAGIIDIVGKTGPEGEVEGGGGASWGSISAYAGGGTRRLRTFVNARLFHVGALRLVPGVEVPYHFEDAYAGAVFGPSNRPSGRITLFATQDRAGEKSRDSFLDWDNLVLGTRWRLIDQGAVTLEVATSAARFREDGLDVPGLRTLGRADLHNRFSRLGAGADLAVTGTRTRAAVGIGLGRRSIVNRIEVADPEVDGFRPFQTAALEAARLEFAGYGELSRRVGPLTLEAAVRLDQAGTAASLQPRFHVRWAVAPKAEVSAALGRTSRLFHLLGEARSEPDFDFLDFWQSAGDSIPIARVDHASLDLNLDLSPIIARLSAYLSRGEGIGEVRPSYDNRPRPFDFFRFGRSRTAGIEAQLGYRGGPGRSQSVSVTYVYARSDRRWDDRWIRWAQDRRHQLRLFGQIQFGRLTVLAAVDAATGMPATGQAYSVARDIPALPGNLDNPLLVPFPVPGPENAVATSGTFRADAGLNWELGRPGQRRRTIGVGIINLLQTEVAPIGGDPLGRGRSATDRAGAPTGFRRLFTLPGFPTVTLRIEL